MAVYFMHGKTFLNQYVKEDPEKVFHTQYVIVSSMIRKNGKYKDRVIIASNLYPNQQLLLDYDDYKHDKNYRNGYKSEVLDEAKALLATIIKYSIEEKSTVVFLCGHKEKRYDYLKLIQEYVEDEFGFHIYDYKKYKEGKEKIVKYNPSVVLSECDKIIKKEKKKANQQLLSSEQGRTKYFDSLSKKDLKKKLEKRNLYYEGMSKSEMIEMLDTFI